MVVGRGKAGFRAVGLLRLLSRGRLNGWQGDGLGGTEVYDGPVDCAKRLGQVYLV